MASDEALQHGTICHYLSLSVTICHYLTEPHALEQAGDSARACFETLAISRRLEQSLASSESMEVMNALELAFALGIERLSLGAMRHMLSAVLESWSSALDQEDEEQGVAAQDEQGSLAAPQYPVRRAAPTIAHERRLHALSRYVAKRTAEMPADMCEELLAHLHALVMRDDHEFSALALSSLGRPPPSCVCRVLVQDEHAESACLGVLASACSPTRRGVKRHKVVCMRLRLAPVSGARASCLCTSTCLLSWQ